MAAQAAQARRTARRIPAAGQASSGGRALRALAATALLVLVAACGTFSHPAPVEDRAPAHTPPHTGAPGPDTARPAASAASAAGTAAREQTYTVKPGDTLMRIGLDTGQSWRDLQRWNGIDNPNVIEVGQVLKVSPPTGEATTKALPPTAKVEAKPLAPAGAASAPITIVTTTTTATTGPAPAAPATPLNVAPAAPHDAEGEPQWAWPAAGAVTMPFEDPKNKGLNIAGKAGDPVLAAADGRVVYAGSGLYGYGNLVIVKHNTNYLTAYAFNQTLLVKEDQYVKRGQKIAEMGMTGTDRVQLHFEIRRLGKPIDPAQLLPPR